MKRVVLVCGMALGLLFTGCADDDDAAPVPAPKAIKVNRFICINHDNGIGCGSGDFPEGTSPDTHTFITYYFDESNQSENEMPTTELVNDEFYNLTANISSGSVILCSQNEFDNSFDGTECFEIRIVAIPIQ